MGAYKTAGKAGIGVFNKGSEVADKMIDAYKKKKYIKASGKEGRNLYNAAEKVLKKSAISIIGHYEGLCHVYVDQEADLNMAIKVVKNSKMRNVSICGAAETLLIDKMCLKTHCGPILNHLSKLGCKIIGDKII